MEKDGFVLLPEQVLESDLPYYQQIQKSKLIVNVISSFINKALLVVQEQPNCATCSRIEHLETLWNMSLEAKKDLVYAITDIYHDSIIKENLAFRLQQGLYKLQDFWEQDVKGVWRCALWIRNEIAALS